MKQAKNALFKEVSHLQALSIWGPRMKALPFHASRSKFYTGPSRHTQTVGIILLVVCLIAIVQAPSAKIALEIPLMQCAMCTKLSPNTVLIHSFPRGYYNLQNCVEEKEAISLQPEVYSSEV